MTRYSFFAIVFVCAVLFMPKPNVYAIDTVTEVKKSKEKAEDGTEVLTLSIKTDDGTEIKATALPGQLKFRISGVIRPSQFIKLCRLTKKAYREPLTAKEKELEKNIEELLEFSGSFVEPFFVEVDNMLDLMKYEKVKTEFLFLGEENPDRKIKVKISFIDEEGKVFHEEEKITTDHRITAKEFYGKFISGGVTASMRNINSLSLKIDRKYMDKMAEFEITFTQEKQNEKQKG